jgi:hypothetical protein
MPREEPGTRQKELRHANANSPTQGTKQKAAKRDAGGFLPKCCTEV